MRFSEKDAPARAGMKTISNAENRQNLQKSSLETLKIEKNGVF